MAEKPRLIEIYDTSQTDPPALDENGNSFVAMVWPASDAAVHRILESVVGDDGRSDWQWLVLANGDVMLGVWPTGDVYEVTSNIRAKDYEATQ